MHIYIYIYILYVIRSIKTNLYAAEDMSIYEVWQNFLNGFRLWKLRGPQLYNHVKIFNARDNLMNTQLIKRQYC